MKSPQTIVALTAATLLLVVLFVLNLAMGSVSIPWPTYGQFLQETLREMRPTPGASSS